MKVAKVSLFVVLAVGFLVFGILKFFPQGEGASEKLPVIAKLSNFQLKDQEGEVFSSKDLEGRVWVSDFIFTRCAGPCPLMTDRMAELQQTFKGKADVSFVTITMDALHDTPDVLEAFGKKHGADFSNWYFLTGDSTSILDIARNIYKVPADKDPEMHTTRFILVDKESNIRGYYDSLDDGAIEKLKKAIRILNVE